MKFHDLYYNINIPVLIFQDEGERAVVYRNRSANVLLDPVSKGMGWAPTDGAAAMESVLRLPEGRMAELLELLDRNGTVSGFSTPLVLYSGEVSQVNLSAGRLTWDGRRYLQVCIYAGQTGVISQLNTEAVATALNLAYQASTTDEAISSILAFVGNYAGVSRCYIFESTSETTTSNTYEWCGEGVEPAIEQLQHLPKDEYTYDEIIQNGLAVTDDIRRLSAADRAILEPQGIKSLAIVPIISQKGALGYVGLDDCKRYRSWSGGEVQLLQDIADMLASLLTRRDAERGVQYSLNILTTVTNSLDKVVCVSDLGRRTILFANNVLAKTVGEQAKNLEGKPLAPVMEKWGENITNYFPQDELLGPGGEIRKKEHSWEFFNRTTERWYLMQDAVITWIDGHDVLIETATDITYHKDHEARLQWVASTDLMTGVYNRESGRKLFENILGGDREKQIVSLVFLDLDNLKRTNDLFGHAAGDELILSTVAIIQSSIRKSDIICRWGGDEFILLIRTDMSRTEAIMQKIQEKLDRYNSEKDRKVKLSFSYGIVETGDEREKNVDELIAIADQRMYRRKLEKKLRAAEETT